MKIHLFVQNYFDWVLKKSKTFYPRCIKNVHLDDLHSGKWQQLWHKNVLLKTGSGKRATNQPSRMSILWPTETYSCRMRQRIITAPWWIKFRTSAHTAKTLQSILENWAIPGHYFLYFRLFNTVDSLHKFCRWLDSNCGPLMLNSTNWATTITKHKLVTWVSVCCCKKWWLSASVCAYDPAAPGSIPKRDIYDVWLT